MGKNIGKNTSKNLSGKYNQQLLDHAKHSAADALKSSSKRLIKKTAETTGDLMGNKILWNKLRGSQKSPKSSTQTFTNEHDKEIPEEIYIFLEGRQKIIHELRLK